MAKTATPKTEQNSPALSLAAGMMAANPLASKAWMEVMTESARFLRQRIEQDIETQQAMLKCKTPGELVQVQNDFYQTAMKDYTEEATKLFRLVTDATEETVQEVRKVAKRSYDDVPL